MAYDTVSVHPYTTNLNGTLQEDGVYRTVTGIELCVAESIPLTLSGLNTPKTEHFEITYAEAMRRYAVEYAANRGITLPEIIMEERTRDSVGHAFFLKNNVMVPRGWTDAAVVTSTYHVPRLEEIFGFVFGDGFNITIVGAYSVLDNSNEIPEKGKKAIAEFRQTFDSIAAGDDAGIKQRLLAVHPFYQGREDLFR